MDRPGEESPLEILQVRLCHTRRIDADHPPSPAVKELEVTGSLQDNHLGIRDVETQVRVEDLSLIHI